MKIHVTCFKKENYKILFCLQKQLHSPADFTNSAVAKSENNRLQLNYKLEKKKISCSLPGLMFSSVNI